MTQQQYPELYFDSRDQYQQQQSWPDYYQHHQYEAHKTTSFTPTQIPSHITVHHNHWRYAQEQRFMCMPPQPLPTARHFRYANPHWKNQNQVFGHTQNNYGENKYPGSHRHRNLERQRPFVSRLNETGNGPKGPSRVHNPSRFRYVSESYLRSLKENNITCSQTSQPRNVQVAIIKPLARVANSQEDEKVSSCELDSDTCKKKDNSDACKNKEMDSTGNAVTLLEIMGNQVSSDLYCTNETNEKQSETDLNSNNLSNVSTPVPSSNIVKPLSEEQKESDETSVCDESKTTLPPIISNLFAKHSLGKCTIETEYTSNHENVDNNFNQRNNLSDSYLVANSNINNLAHQYNETTIERVEPQTMNVDNTFNEGYSLSDTSLISNSNFDNSTHQHNEKTIEFFRTQTMNVDNTFNEKNNLSDLSLISNSNFDNLTHNEKALEIAKPQTITGENYITVHQDKEKPKSKIDPNSTILSEVPKSPTFHSPIACRSSIKTSQEENEIKNINKPDFTEFFTEFKPFSQSKNSEFHITRSIEENTFPEMTLRTLEKSTCDENPPNASPDVLTPEMLRERLFRRFINSELLMPVESNIQDQNFIDHGKKIETLLSNTLKITGMNPSDLEFSPKHDKHFPIKTDDGSLFTNESSESLCLHKGNNSECSPDKLLNICTKNTAEDHCSSKQLEPIPKIEKPTDSSNGNLQLDLFNENVLKVLSNVNLFSNLDILFLKDILAKIKTSTAPINNKRVNTKSELVYEKSSLQNISLIKNTKMECVNDSTAIPSEYLQNESNLCEKILSPKKEKTSALDEEEIDTSLMLNLESVEECMINSVSVVHIQSEILEDNKSDKKDTNWRENDKKHECHVTETSPSHKSEKNKDNHNSSEMKPQTKTFCEKHLASLKDPVCTLEGKISDEVKIVPMINSSLNDCSSNNENLSNDMDLLTIEYNLDKMFGMEEGNHFNVSKEKSPNRNTEQNKLIPNKNVELVDKDIQSNTALDLPKQMEHDCESFVSEDKNLPEIDEKSDNHIKRYFIEYSPSMKITDNNDAISISSDEVGDGDDCFPGEENFDFQQHSDESKLIEHENEDANNDLEKNNSKIESSLVKKEINNGDYGIDISSNVKIYENNDSNNKINELVGPYNKFSGVEKSRIKLYRINEHGMAFEADDDLPDLNKNHLEKSLFNYNIDKNNGSYLDVNENINTGANDICNSERIANLANICGISDCHQTESLKWNVSQKRAYHFSKDNLQSHQVTESSIINLQKTSELISPFRSTLKSGRKTCKNGNYKSTQKDELLKQDHCGANKSRTKTQAKLKRLFDNDFSEDAPKKKLTVKKTNLKCKPKDRKININKVSVCLSPKSLSKALETSSYIIEDKVANLCPLGHSLEKCYSTVNVNTKRISIFCQTCKIMILMGENT